MPIGVFTNKIISFLCKSYLILMEDTIIMKSLNEIFIFINAVQMYWEQFVKIRSHANVS